MSDVHAPTRRPVATRRAVTLVLLLVAALLASLTPATGATTPEPRRIMTGWMPYWTTAASTASVVANSDLFGEVSPFWYAAGGATGIPVLSQQVSETSKATALAALHGAGVKVLPSITDGTPAHRMAAVMTNPNLRAGLVASIVKLVKDEGYDGIDLDFERFAFSDGKATWPTTRPAWVAFIKALYTALHAQGKVLAVTTPPIYDATRSATSGYWVYDWAAIAPYVDRLRIMAYDYSVSGGPIAPFFWVEDIVRFAVTQVPSGRIWVGVPAYGRNAVVRVWSASQAAYVPKVVGTCPTNRPSNYLSTLSFTAADATTAIPTAPNTSANVDRTAAVRTWNPAYGGRTPTHEMQFTYQVTYKGTTSAGATTSCKVYRTGWYDPAASAIARAKLVGTYHLAGIAEWTLGGEDPAQWAGLRSYARTIAPNPTTVALRATTPTTWGQASHVLVTARSAGLAVEAAVVTLQSRAPGATTWTPIASSVTTAAGTASFAPIISGATVFRAVVSGTFERSSGWAAANVAVRTAVQISLSSTSVTPGHSVRVTARLKPVRLGQRAVVQVYASGHWKTLASTTADRYGRAMFTVRPTVRHATTHYRVVASAIGSTVGNYGHFYVHLA